MKIFDSAAGALTVTTVQERGQPVVLARVEVHADNDGQWTWAAHDLLPAECVTLGCALLGFAGSQYDEGGRAFLQELIALAAKHGLAK